MARWERSGTGPEAGPPRLTIGFIARATLVVIALWALANVVWLGRELFFVIFLAVLVALFLSIFVDRIEGWGIPRAVAAPAVLVVVIAVVTVLWLLAWPTLRSQVLLLRGELPGAIADVEAWIRDQYEALTGEVGRPNGELTRQLQRRLQGEVVNIVAGALPLLNTVIGALFGGFIAIFGGLYLTIESRMYVAGITKLVPPPGRARVRQALEAAGSDLRRWIMGTMINMLLVGSLTTVGLWLMGIPAALALGLIAGFLEFIPIFGPILSAVPAVAVALILSPEDAIWVVVLYTAIQQVEANVIAPLVMRGVVEIPPALTIFVGALMAILFGFLGLLLAVPILAVMLVLVRRLYVDRIEAGW